MARSRAVLALAVTLVVAAVSEAQPPRQPTVTTPTPLAVVLLSGIDDKNIVAELKLSEEQVKTLVARRQELWDEVYTTAPRRLAEGARERVNATDSLLKKTLTEAQYRRAAQLAAQDLLSKPYFFLRPARNPTLDLTRVSITTLNGYPELAAAFRLTDEQKKELTARADPDRGFGPTRTITMKPEQADAAKEFLGPMFIKRWDLMYDPRLDNSPEQPFGFLLLSARGVRADLEMTDDQAKALAAVHAKWRKLNDDSRADLSPKEVNSQAAALKSESEKLLATTLRQKQGARLKQIVFQVQHDGTHIERLYRNSEVVLELVITDQQRKKFDDVRQTFQQKTAKVFEAGESFATTEQLLKELAAARRAKAEDVLTAKQAAKLRELIGEPFTGSAAPDSDRGFNGDRDITQTFRAALFGKYSTEFSQLAANMSIQEELKMTPEQIKQAVATRDELRSKFPISALVRDPDALAKMHAEESKAIEAALGKLLSAGQAKRFREIMLQSCEQPRTFRPRSIITSAVAYPDMAEAVKLSDAQRKKLFAGTLPAEVLTADQKAMIAKQLGEPFKGDFTIHRTGPTLSAAARLFAGRVRGPEPEEALKLTPEQAMKIDAAQEKYKTTLRAIVGRSGPLSNDPETTKALTVAMESYEKVITATLTPDQARRTVQLVLQGDAASSLVATLTDPETAKTLGLTTDQTGKLNTLDEDAERLQELLVREGVSDPERKLALRLRDAADERMLAVLTDAQKTKWKEMTGEPWEGLRKRIPGSFGGFGGRGRGSNP